MKEIKNNKYYYYYCKIYISRGLTVGGIFEIFGSRRIVGVNPTRWTRLLELREIDRFNSHQCSVCESSFAIHHRSMFRRQKEWQNNNKQANSNHLEVGIFLVFSRLLRFYFAGWKKWSLLLLLLLIATIIVATIIALFFFFKKKY